jgi:sulfonate transport system permease protein
MKETRFLVSVCSVILGLAVWEAAGMREWIDLRFFPRPSAILNQAYEQLVYGGLLRELQVSLWRVAVGSVIAVPAALLLALASEMSWFAGAALRPWVSFLYPMPKLAMLPLFLVLFGLGETSKIALVAVGVFFLVFLSASQGLRRIMQSEYYDVALVYRVPLAGRIFSVLLRGAMPEIVSGIKLGLGYALVMVIAAEFTASQQGIGVFVWNAWDQFRILDLYSGLLLIGLVGWLIFAVSSVAERLFSRYD